MERELSEISGSIKSLNIRRRSQNIYNCHRKVLLETNDSDDLI
jgi:hypothetical protein